MNDRITDTIAEALREHQWRGGILGCGCGWEWPEERTHFCGEDERIAKAHTAHQTAAVLAALRANNIEPIQLPEIDALEHFELTGDGVRQYDPNGFGAYRFFSFAEMRELAGSFLAVLAAAAAAEEGRS